MLAEAFTELVVLSHRRWPWVWQRPQHLISRIGATVDTTFVEEPMPVEGCAAPRLVHERADGVRRMWLEVDGTDHWVGFDDERAEGYVDALRRQLPPRPGRVV